MRVVVGFDRKVKREWLDALVDQVAQCQDAAHLRTFLDSMLKSEHPGETARGKTMTVLMRIWALVPEQDRHLRQDAFELLKVIPAQDRIWLHWGMCLVAYPLFRDSATAIGRLLKLQGEFTLAQLQRKLLDRWGERSTVTRAFQRIVRSMVEWGTLADAEAPGHFKAASVITTSSKPLQLWFLRAGHEAGQEESVEVGQLLNQPLAFPFRLALGLRDLRRSASFSIHRQGIDMDMVGLPQRARYSAARK